MKYEYKIISLHPNTSDDDILKNLNDLGEEGWELVSIHLTNPTVGIWPHYYFKRIKGL